jgi:myo-inositol 2-dehydrogenase / D-chiro-inositol 1-dehydrogenase
MNHPYRLNPKDYPTPPVPNQSARCIPRRQFFTRTATALGAAPLLCSLAAEPAAPERPQEFKRKIKIGVVGNGGRGGWIAGLFAKHGGYEMHAVADYFQEVADKCGDALGVDKARRFSTLSGYKRLIESGVEAVALETPPYFFPEHACAAVEAGLHVYMAKPVAVDVPGCLAILDAGKQASRKQRCFLVDYQIPTDPHNLEIVKRIAAGQIGRVAMVCSRYFANGLADPPLTPTIESRLHGLIWCNDVALGGSHHVNACIHSIDAVLWALGKRPISASGFSQRARPEPHGDSHDALAVSYEFADGVVWSHCGKHLPTLQGFESAALIEGVSGFAQIAYGGQVRIRGTEDGYSGEVTDLYEAGAKRNIAEFYRLITEEQVDNPVVGRAVDGALTTILSREAALRRTRLTMEQLLQENRRLEVDLKGLRT